MRRNALIVSLAVAASVAAPLVCGTTQTLAQTTPPPATGEGESGRYSLSQTGDQFIRLDSRTGAISSCSNKGSGWACYTLPDERSALDGEIGRLETENARLKSELVKRESMGTVPPAAKAAAPPAKNEAKNEATNEIKSAPGIATKNDAKSAAAAASKTAAVEPPAQAEVPPAAAGVAGDNGKIDLPPTTSEGERKDGFLSRVWQQLIGLARMFSRG